MVILPGSLFRNRMTSDISRHCEYPICISWEVQRRPVRVVPVISERGQVLRGPFLNAQGFIPAERANMFQ